MKSERETRQRGARSRKRRDRSCARNWRANVRKERGKALGGSSGRVWWRQGEQRRRPRCAASPGDDPPTFLRSSKPFSLARALYTALRAVEEPWRAKVSANARATYLQRGSRRSWKETNRERRRRARGGRTKSSLDARHYLGDSFQLPSIPLSVCSSRRDTVPSGWTANTYGENSESKTILIGLFKYSQCFTSGDRKCGKCSRY